MERVNITDHEESLNLLASIAVWMQSKLSNKIKHLLQAQDILQTFGLQLARQFQAQVKRFHKLSHTEMQDNKDLWRDTL